MNVNVDVDVNVNGSCVPRKRPFTFTTTFTITFTLGCGSNLRWEMSAPVRPAGQGQEVVVPGGDLAEAEPVFAFGSEQLRD